MPVRHQTECERCYHPLNNCHRELVAISKGKDTLTQEYGTVYVYRCRDRKACRARAKKGQRP